MLRFYGFKAEEMVSTAYPDLDEELDPKSSWALRHTDFFPLDVNRASYEELLRIPGVGVLSARKIIQARRCRKLDLEHLQKIGVVLRRARYFLDLPSGQGYFSALLSSPEMLRQALLPRKSSREHPGQKRLPLEEPSLLSS
jgi:predicted DNA-binding helix-hairpin-helix protein